MALASAMAAIAIDTLLPAFEQMRPAFGLDSDSTRLSLTLTLFFAGMAVGTLFYGPLADAIGRKPLLFVSLGLYAAAAVVGALAPSLEVLLASRFVWGFAAAGPRTLTQAIVRDRFSGTAMARAMTLIQTAFFLGPILAPILGKGLVALGSWRYVMVFGAVSAGVLALWSLRLPETLAEENRRPLTVGNTVAGFRSVIANRTTLGYTLAVTFGFGAFFSFLASSELIFVDVYSRPSWFVPYFSTMSTIAAGVSVMTNRMLRRVEAGPLALRSGVALVVTSGALLAATAAASGLPRIGVWILLFSLANASFIGFFPVAISLALEPMGAMAGTAAAVVGFCTTGVGAVLAAITDRAIDGDVMPIGVSYFVYGVLALACQLWARRETRRAAV
ncbi:MFS transporter [Candidatus Poriferisodalis sp.]|uniref:MFS transporter n=1 Tax=Candidatus Poriferisodalis sp. TaxID=3101277 RepID=UPI003D0A72D5